MFRSFQTRLIFFSWILFAVVGALTFFLVQNAIRDNIFDRARQQLIDSNEIFNQRVAATADTLGESATILASGYGFRQAFSTDDRPTILSALHNLGHRFRADRFFLLSLDGNILADTGSAVDAAETGDIVTIGAANGVFPFADMIETAGDEGSAAAYVFRPAERQRLTLEVLHVKSDRAERRYFGVPTKARETVLQASYRFFFGTGN